MLPQESIPDFRECDWCDNKEFLSNMVTVDSDHGDRTAYFCSDECCGDFIAEYTVKPNQGDIEV